MGLSVFNQQFQLKKQNKSNVSTLHEKPYIPNPGLLWEAQKHQVNIIFLSNFWLKEDHISGKFKTRTLQ